MMWKYNKQNIILAIIFKNGIKKIIKDKFFNLNNNKNKIFIYKKFKNKIIADIWLNKINFLNNSQDIINMFDNIIFCDSGVSSKHNILEIKILYQKKNILINKFQQFINYKNNLFLSSQYTNNFGELLGVFLSLEYAIKNKIKYICTDSTIVAAYWINNFFSNKINVDTKNIIQDAIILYKIFLKNKGKLFIIPSHLNFADVNYEKKSKKNPIIEYYAKEYK